MQRVGTFVLSLIACCSLSVVATAAPSESVPVVVEAHGTNELETVRLEVLTEEAAGVFEEVTVPLTNGIGRWTLHVAERSDRALDSAAVIEAKAPGYWSRPREVVTPRDRPLRVHVWRAGSFAASLRGPRGESLPQEVKVLLQEPAPRGEVDPAQPERAEVPCPIADGQLAECLLPAGVWHLRLEAPGFIPRYRWDVSVAAGETLDLGKLTLKAGSAIFGRLLTEIGPADPETALVELRPLLDRTILDEAEEVRIEQLATTLPINDWGYFHFDGISPGTYELTARQPGFSELSPQKVEVSRSAVTELAEPLVLTRPRRLSVVVQPPKQPDGRPWNVHLYDATQLRGRQRLAAGRTNEEGLWTSHLLRSGNYSVQVLGGSSRSMAWKKVDVVQEVQEVVVKLELVRVEGKLLLGDDPLAGRLWFGGRFGAVRLRTEADEEGEFVVTLPHGATWRVDVVNRDANVHSRDLEVDVEPHGPSNTAEVEIELPDTVLQGEVVDVRDAPVSGAKVRLAGGPGGSSPMLTVTDEEGGFSFQGQTPGSYAIEALDRGGHRRSRRKTVQVSEAKPQRSVRLVVQDHRVVEGRVVSRSAPVRRARVLGFPMTAERSLSSAASPSARTEVDGSFRLEVPAATEVVRLVILAPGHPLQMRTVRVDRVGGDDLLIETQQESGVLRVASAVSEGGTNPDRVPVVLIDGQMIEMALLEYWAGMNGSRRGDQPSLTISAMPPGVYNYCEVSPQEFYAVLTGAAVPQASACSEGVLTAGGTLDLP